MICCLDVLVKQRPWRFGLALPTQSPHEDHSLLGKERCWRHSTRKRMASPYVRVATCEWGLLSVIIRRWTVLFSVEKSDIIQHGSIQRVTVGRFSSEQCYYAGALYVTKSSAASRRTTRQTWNADSWIHHLRFSDELLAIQRIKSVVSNDNLDLLRII